MSPRAQNLLSLATLAISLVIASFPTKAQSAMITRATGEFEVNIQPVAEERSEGGSLGRMSLDKQFRGPLEGSSRGELK